MDISQLKDLCVSIGTTLEDVRKHSKVTRLQREKVVIIGYLLKRGYTFREIGELLGYHDGSGVHQLWKKHGGQIK